MHDCSLQQQGVMGVRGKDENRALSLISGAEEQERRLTEMLRSARSKKPTCYFLGGSDPECFARVGSSLGNLK